ncbi:MAG: mannose-1-phosphate guanylyltransferase [Betaproteobacteria bacterium RIFCSPLOWO2_02_FULL_62_17]|nr:MAG: mannose-1-phosphate guanylyltransferase [Betaproteobacteria bacterium RIFCSPLOWO2_02_FULL_62_17]
MKAMILAAGRGERVRPLSDVTPKPLLTAGGKPLIVWMLERLREGGIREIVINHAHLGAQIEAALGDGARFGVSIRYSAECEALETAGGIANALDLLGDAPFIAAAGDIYCDYDFGKLCSRDLGAGLAHLVLIPNPPHNLKGDFALDGSALQNNGSPRHTFSGIGLYDPRLFTGIKPGSRHKLAHLLREAADAGKASGELYVGDWFDIGTPERLADLDRRLSRV